MLVSCTGLPEEQKQKESTLPKHNLNFLKKAYARCEANAEETGQSLEDIAAERFGVSQVLDAIYALLAYIIVSSLM